ncbi:MAG: amidohydrolase family protein, partial [Nitrososphaerales archaeon]
MKYDKIIRNGKIVIPKMGILEGCIGINEGKISTIARDITPTNGDKVIDAKGKLIFPGVIDSHFHIGIYRPIAEDAYTESRAAVTGGVTTILSYFRTGSHYLNITGPYSEVYPKLLDITKFSFLTDYGYHLAPIERHHIDEMELLITEYGVCTFKYYMFYKGLELRGHGVSGEHEKKYLLTDEPQDLGHLFQIMRQAALLNKKYGSIRVSVHAEDPELIRVNMEEAKEAKSRGIRDLEAYNMARSSIAEKIAIVQTVYLASLTGCPLNILHLSSRGALEAATQMRNLFHDVFFETTIHHLTLTTDIKSGIEGKVNPPLRTKDDVEALWRGIHDNIIQIVVSDHAAIMRDYKITEKDNIWTALPGFGGTTLLLPILLSEGYYKRGISLLKIADLVCYNPAKIHGLYPKKGTIKIGVDADLTIVDLNKVQTVTADILNSAQDFTPFEGIEVKGWPNTTLIRGETLFEDGQVIGK